jgi:hypothetical protein
MAQKTALTLLLDYYNDLVEKEGDKITSYDILQKVIRKAAELKEKEKQEMLEFGSRVTERWGLTSVEPHYIEDEYNKVYKGFSAE